MEDKLEKEITNIFITIDNYGTAQEARDEIKTLIDQEVKKARIDTLNELQLYAENKISDRIQGKYNTKVINPFWELEGEK